MTCMPPLVLCLLGLGCTTPSGNAKQATQAAESTTQPDTHLRLGPIDVVVSGSTYLSINADGKVAFEGKAIGRISSDGNMLVSDKVVATLTPNGSIVSDDPAFATTQIDMRGGIKRADETLITVDEAGRIHVAPSVLGGKLQYNGAKESYRAASFVLVLSLAPATEGSVSGEVSEQVFATLEDMEVEIVGIAETLDELEPDTMTEAQQAERDAEKRRIKEQIRTRLPQIRLCYEKELLKNPALSGRARVDFVIRISGEVSNVQATQGFHPKVDSCVVSEIRKLVFPKREQPTTVRYPFTFEPA